MRHRAKKLSKKCGKTVAMTIIQDYGNLFVRNGMHDEATGNQRLRAAKES